MYIYMYIYIYTHINAHINVLYGLLLWNNCCKQIIYIYTKNIEATMVISYIRIIVDFCYIWIMDCIHKQPRLWLDFIISYAVQSDHGGIKEPQ